MLINECSTVRCDVEKYKCRTSIYSYTQKKIKTEVINGKTEKTRSRENDSCT